MITIRRLFARTSDQWFGAEGAPPQRLASQGGFFAKGVGVVAFVTISSVAVFTTAFAAASTPTTLQGVLMDKECSPKAESRVVSGADTHLEGGMLWAYTHTRQCLLMPSCQRTGYGIVPYEQEHFIAFDAAGSQKALALIQSTKKQDDMRIEVTGVVDGDKMKVTGLKFLPD